MSTPELISRDPSDARILCESIKQLRERFHQLANGFEHAADQLRSSGAIPSDAFVEQIVARRREFTDLVSQAVEWLKARGQDTKYATSLNELDKLLEEIKSRSDLFDQANELLRPLLSLRHKANRLASALAKVQEAVQEILTEIADSNNLQSVKLAQSVVDHTHPASALCILVTSDRSADEDLQAPFAERVSQAFGAPLMLAAVQGHLEIGVPVTSEDDEHHVDRGPTPREPIAAISTQSDHDSLITGTIPEPKSTLNVVSDSHGTEVVDPAPEVAEVFTHANSETIDAEDRAAEDSQDVYTESSAPFEPLSEDLASFDEFCRRKYLNCKDIVVPTPWHSVDRGHFSNQLRDLAREELKARRLCRVWLISRALQQLDELPDWAPEDISSLAALLRDSHDESAGADPTRTARLQEQRTKRIKEDQRLPLFLHAIRPGFETIDAQLIDKFVDGSEFVSNDLKEFVRKCLKYRVYGGSPIDRMRERLAGTPQRSRQNVAGELTTARSKFQSAMIDIWSAAGGKLQRTHCREAWDRFIRKIEPTIKKLYPPPQGLPRWDVTEAGNQINDILSTHRKIADAGEVQHMDRRKADRAAERIFEGASRINQLMAELQQAGHESVERPERSLPQSELQHILDANSVVHDPLESLLVLLLQQLFQDQVPAVATSEYAALQFDLADFVDCPDLLGVVEPQSVSKSADEASPHCDVSAITDYARGAAYLLERTLDDKPRSRDGMIQRLLDRHRFDLAEVIDPLLRAADREAVRRQKAEFTQKASEIVVSVSRRWRHLHDMASPAASALGQAHRTAGMLVDRQLAQVSRPYLFLEWLKLLAAYGEQEEQRTLGQLKSRAAQIESAERRELVLQYLEQYQYAEALWALGENPPAGEPWQRETIWRSEAEKLFANSFRTLKQYRTELEFAGDLLEHWIGGCTGDQRTDRPLRTTFSKLMFSVPSDQSDSPVGENEADSFSISCKGIVDWIASQNLNPSFLPQLRRFAKIVILSPLCRVESAALVEKVCAQIAGRQGNLAVVLMPRVTAAVRNELHAELRESGLPAAVFDDIDLCRLLHPQPRRNLVGRLLEIMFEQQDRRAFSPFEKHDGQHVKLEMFVGRAEQAGEIALTPQYSRLFSGRKLGKSALLSFVEQKYDGYNLPSGLTLRVVYVSGVSAGEEAVFVDRVLGAIRERLDYSDTANEVESDVASRLTSAFDRLVVERSNESLLVLFDEADLFVERQIDEYDRRREACLSFVIRSQVEAKRDSHGLPRIRFLFSGYRVTHKNAGAWAGAWGDVLRLEPLQPEEASKLVRGPIERLGIRASDVAGLIAWRCGYQPSIIISFCRQLLTLNADRISAEDVSRVFDDPKIQDEIRTVIDSNFQGNNVARIVFLTTVLIYHERHPLEGIRDLPEVLLKRLGVIVEEQKWLDAADEKSALNRLESLVQDFVRRQLLRVESTPQGAKIYFPRFPHHLPVLAQELSREPEDRIRGDIAAYERGAEFERNEAVPAQWLFPRPITERLREVAGAPVDTELPLKAIVLTANWEEALLLNVILPDVQPVDANGKDCLSEERWTSASAVCHVSGELFSNMPTTRPLAPPLLLGGADLLRAVLVREQDADELYHIECLGRISQSNLRWWFHRHRALELKDRSYDVIMQETSGIPWLVGLLDGLLRERHPGGANLSEDDVQGLLAEFRPRLAAGVCQLRDGPRPVRLTPRELEILRMVVRASRDEPIPGTGLKDHLTGLWDELYRPDSPFEAFSPDDTIAMSVVQRLGMVPVRDNISPSLAVDRFVSVAPGDAVCRIVEFLG